MKKIRDEKGLGFGDIVFDTSSDDEKRPDALIFQRPQSTSVICIIEFKKPTVDFLALNVRGKTQSEAIHRGSPYFAISNFQELVWFDSKSGEEKDWLSISQIEDLNLIEDVFYKSAILRGLEQFLNKLFEYHTGKAALPRRNIDELLIYYLQQKVKTLSRLYTPIIRDQVHKEKSFAKSLWKWMEIQGWERSDEPEKDYAKVARQAAYLLVNKIIFYDALQAKVPERLDKLEIPESLTKGGRLQHELQGYFNEVLKIDYETIYGDTEFIDKEIAFPDHREVVEAIKDLINFLKPYRFEKIGVDIVGRIFERLIPENERHLLGQYFTDPNIVDLILKYCMRHEDDKLFDPACGTGTFLVRAYHHKKLMNDRLTHEAILKTVWGNDIAKFPHTLTMINLALNDLSVEKNYPNIMQEDFFNLFAQHSGFELPESHRNRLIKTLGREEKEIIYPRWFDCIVGNPPYTRSHEKESGAWGKNKDLLIKQALNDPNGRKLADIPANAGIHAYFFVHGFKFLQNEGRFGFIVSNSWLNADYGAGLQEFFLNNAKIIAIIESAVERWFADADINTCIIILEKCANSKERNENLVRFVQLKKTLSVLFPTPVDDIREHKRDRKDEVESLINTIGAHNSFYENNDMRIFPKKQSELWAEGYDPKAEKYIGSKWEPYIIAPRIFFTILQKARGKMIPLRLLGEVNEGKATGANEYFYPKKEIAEKRKIENRYLHPGLMKVRGFNYFQLQSKHIDRYFFSTGKSDRDKLPPGALGYIEYGERQKIHKGKTFAIKTLKNWYQLEARKPAELLIPCGMRERLYCTLNSAKAISSNSYTEIRLKNPKIQHAIWLFFNSVIGWLFFEMYGRGLGGGGGMLKVDPTDIRKMFIISPEHLDFDFSKVKSLLDRPVGTVEDECKAEDRKLLDDLIMGKVLKLTSEEQNEVYSAVIDLVKTRLTKATSVKGKKTIHDGIDTAKLIEEFKNNVTEDGD